MISRRDSERGIAVGQICLFENMIDVSSFCRQNLPGVHALNSASLSGRIVNLANIHFFNSFKTIEIER
jgi:hypothetical protein